VIVEELVVVGRSRAVEIFHGLSRSYRSMVLQSTQSIMEVSTKAIIWGWRRPGCRAYSLATFICR